MQSMVQFLRDLRSQFSWQAAAAGIPLFILYLLVSLVAATMILLVAPDVRSVRGYTFAPYVPLYLAALLIALNALFEELVVTGFVIQSLAGKGAGVAITASTLLRFAYHLYQGPLAALSILPVGLLFATMYWRWRNLWPLMVAHTIASLVVFALNPQRPA